MINACVLRAVVWLLVISTQIWIHGTAAVSLDAGEAGHRPVRAFASTPLPHDFFANALKVGSQVVSVYTANTQLASLEADEAFLAHGAEANATSSIWYSWTVRERTELLVDTAGSSYATVIGVYSGTTLDSLVRVAGASSAVQGRDAWVRFTAEPNVSYKIAIAGLPPDAVGLARIRFEVNGQPDLARPVLEVLRPTSGTTVRDTRVRIEGITFDPQPNGSGVREVQYTLSTEGDSIIRNTQGTTNFAATIDLFPGVNVVTFWAWDNADNRSANRRVELLLNPVSATNDLFLDRFVLDPALTARADLNLDATRETGEPSHAGNQGGASIWYEFSSPASGVLLLSTLGSSFDTLLGVYVSANSFELPVRVTNLVEIASSDDVIGGGGYSEATVTVEAGRKYFIAADGFDGQRGVVQLNYRFSPVRVFRLEVQPSNGAGTVTPGSGVYPESATVSVMARPAPGMEFDHFETASGQVRQNPYSIVMTGDVNLRAVFRARTYSEDFEGGFSFSFAAQGWEIQSDPTNRNNRVLMSLGQGRDRLTNSVTLTLRVSDGIGAFDFGVSGETNYDRLELFVSYIQQDRESTRLLVGSWSGERRGRHEFALRAGIARLEWRYVKDSAISGGTDRAFIDNLDLPLFAAQPDVSVTGQTVTLRLSGLGAQSLRVETSPDLVSWSHARTTTPDSRGEAGFQEPANGRARFYRFIPVPVQTGSSGSFP